MKLNNYGYHVFEWSDADQALSKEEKLMLIGVVMKLNNYGYHVFEWSDADQALSKEENLMLMSFMVRVLQWRNDNGKKPVRYEIREIPQDEWEMIA